MFSLLSGSLCNSAVVGRAIEKKNRPFSIYTHWSRLYFASLVVAVPFRLSPGSDNLAVKAVQLYLHTHQPVNA